MTREEATNMLKARLECLKRETSGINLECNGRCDECSLCYEQGDLREQKEVLDMAIKVLEQEPLTDKEQRIFLAAMGREEKVCKQVDDECRDCREPYEDSLVRVCHEIARKVKGALWT